MSLFVTNLIQLSNDPILINEIKRNAVPLLRPLTDHDINRMNVLTPEMVQLYAKTHLLFPHIDRISRNLQIHLDDTPNISQRNKKRKRILSSNNGLRSRVQETAVEKDGMALQYVSSRYRSDPAIVKIAVQQNQNAIRFAIE
ncbi:MAG: DUF4116 domain-containing protein [Sphingobacteriaceae bacterium]|nr:MAG: DUF4116 domain-containing protein [Sphingobacteriaceae bacterium]